MFRRINNYISFKYRPNELMYKYARVFNKDLYLYYTYMYINIVYDNDAS